MNSHPKDSTAIFFRRPALRLLLLLIAGILLGRYVQPNAVIVLIAAAVLFISGVVVTFTFAQVLVLDGILTLIVVSLGACLQSFQRDDFASKKLIPVAEREPIVYEGTIVEEPSIRPNRVQFVLSVERLMRAGVVQPVERHVVVYGRPVVFGDELERVKIGAAVHGHGTLDDYPQQRNPGEFDYGRYLELNGVHGVVAIRDTGLVRIAEEGGGSWRTLPGTLRSILLREVDSLHSEQAAAFLRGILLADRSKLPEDVRQSFVETGTIHVLAVSGLHVGVIALIFYGLFGLLRMPRRFIIICTIAGLLFYMLLVGAPPSVVRATIMAIVILVGLMVERKVDVYQSLSIAALILLVWDSNNLFQVGSQLSFAAVLSIVYFYPILMKVSQFLPQGLQRMKPVKWAVQLFVVSLAAQLGTLPFTAYYFDRISIVSLIANVVVVPVVGLNVMLGFTTLLVSSFSTWLAQSYAALNDFLVARLLEIVKYAASVPLSSVHTGSLDATFPFLYYAGILGVVHVRNSTVIKVLVIVGLVVGNIMVYSSVLRADDAKLRITFIDVWQGDGILIEFPSGKNVLLDAGGRSDTFDSGERTVAPFLRYKGISALDALMMSHPHSDHIGGVPYLLDHFTVRTLIEPTVAGESYTYGQIHQKAAEGNIPIVRYEVGDRINIDEFTRLYVLHPYRQQDSTESLNNASLVVKLVFGASELLLVGDAEREVEAKLLSRYDTILRSGALKVGHHGSITSSSPEFIAAVEPWVSVVSVGKNNKFNHPSPVVLKTLRQHGVELHRTDKEGAIVLESDGRRWEVVDWRDGEK